MTSTSIKFVFLILIASNELSVRCATGSHQFTTLLSILIRFSKKKTKKKTLCPVTVLVDSQVSDHCPWATCSLPKQIDHFKTLMLCYSYRALHYAAGLSGPTDVLELLINYGAAIDACNEECCTPLFFSILANRFYH